MRKSPEIRRGKRFVSFFWQREEEETKVLSSFEPEMQWRPENGNRMKEGKSLGEWEEHRWYNILEISYYERIIYNAHFWWLLLSFLKCFFKLYYNFRWPDNLSIQSSCTPSTHCPPLLTPYISIEHVLQLISQHEYISINWNPDFIQLLRFYRMTVVRSRTPPRVPRCI